MQKITKKDLEIQLNRINKRLEIETNYQLEFYAAYGKIGLYLTRGESVLKTFHHLTTKRILFEYLSGIVDYIDLVCYWDN